MADPIEKTISQRGFTLVYRWQDKDNDKKIDLDPESNERKSLAVEIQKDGKTTKIIDPDPNSKNSVTAKVLTAHLAQIIDRNMNPTPDHSDQDTPNEIDEKEMEEWAKTIAAIANDPQYASTAEDVARAYVTAKPEELQPKNLAEKSPPPERDLETATSEWDDDDGIGHTPEALDKAMREGKFSKAVKIACHSKFEGKRDEVLGQIVTKYLEKDNFDAAQKVAEKILANDNKALALLEIALACMNSKDDAVRRKALAAVGAMPDTCSFSNDPQNKAREAFEKLVKGWKIQVDPATIFKAELAAKVGEHFAVDSAVRWIEHDYFEAQQPNGGGELSLEVKSNINKDSGINALATVLQKQPSAETKARALYLKGLLLQEKAGELYGNTETRAKAISVYKEAMTAFKTAYLAASDASKITKKQTILARMFSLVVDVIYNRQDAKSRKDKDFADFVKELKKSVLATEAAAKDSVAILEPDTPAGKQSKTNPISIKNFLEQWPKKHAALYRVNYSSAVKKKSSK